MTFALNSDVTPTDTEHGTVLLDQRSGRYFQLNPSGGLVLRTLLEGATPERAADVLCERYGITADRAAADVHALLTALREARLATV